MILQNATFDSHLNFLRARNCRLEIQILLHAVMNFIKGVYEIWMVVTWIFLAVYFV